MSNLLKRSLSAVIYAAVIILPLTFYPTAFPVVVIVAMCLMMHEFYGISLGGKFTFESRLMILAAFILFAALTTALQFGWSLKWALLSLVPVIMAMMKALLRKNCIEDFSGIAYLFTGLLYIGVPSALSPILVIRDGEFDGLLMLSFFIMIWAADTGAYLLGSALGQREGARKLAPSISPHKSWWGVAGGVVVTIAATLILCHFGWLDMSYPHALGTGAVISIFSVIGDLFESAWKRAFHIKDSGNLIPGHGGILDRLDSSLTAMPAAAAYMVIFKLL